MALSEDEKQRLGIVDDGLGVSLHSAARKNPDQQANVVKLADSQQLPTDTVERNLQEVDARHHYGHLKPDQIRKDSPVTASYLSDTKNANVSIDDVENLQALENNLKPEHGFWSNAGRGGVGRLNELVGNLIEVGGTLAESYRRTDLPDPGITIDDDGISWHWMIPCLL